MTRSGKQMDAAQFSHMSLPLPACLAVEKEAESTIGFDIGIGGSTHAPRYSEDCTQGQRAVQNKSLLPSSDGGKIETLCDSGL
jgi:hypothetical protein